MKELLKILKAGVTKNDYPVYGQYIHSTGKQLQTYNKSILACVNYELPFKGSTNFFVIENLLTHLETYDIKQINDSIIISSDNFKSELIIDDVGFPRVKNHNYKKGLFVTEELLYILNIAIKFVGNSYYKYVVITNKGVLATDTHRLFCYNKVMDTKSAIFLDKNIINMLKTGYEINFDDNIFVKFDEGYLIFEIDDVSEYDINKIYDHILTYSNNVVRLCNVQTIHDAIQKVSHVLFNENSRCINIFNKKKILTISAESSVNGVASVEYESELENKYESNFDIDKFSNISLDYDVYINKEDSNYMYLKDEHSEIISVAAI